MSTRSARNPGSTAISLEKLRSNRPPPTSSTTAMASCAATSAPKIRRSRWPVDTRAPSLSACPRGRRESSRAGRQAAQQRRHDGQGGREQQNPRVNPDLVQARQRRRRESHERARQPHGEHQAEDAAKHRQERRFGEQLPDEPSAAGAKRAANRDLALPPHGARQHQAGNVGAGNQEDESNGRKRHPQQRARAPANFVGERHHGAAEHVGQAAERRRIHLARIRPHRRVCRRPPAPVSRQPSAAR